MNKKTIGQGRVEIFIGDSRETLKEVPRKSVQTVVTSPPYYGLRDYGSDGQIGLESTPDAYVKNIVDVFREVWEVLRDDGTVWLNLGDSYAANTKGSGGMNSKQPTNAGSFYSASFDLRAANLKPKDLIGIPWRVAFALQADGWYLRQDIIWHKCLSGGTRVYAKTQKGEMPTTIKDLVRLNPSSVKLWDGEKWNQVVSWSETPRPARPLEVVLRSGERIGCTDNHLWPTQRGLVMAGDLKRGDILQKCIIPEPECVRTPEMIPDDVGYFVGLYIAEGSQSDGTIQISGHVNENERLEWLRQFVAKYDGYIAVHNTSGNVATININSTVILGLINTYIGGKTAKDKHLNVRCWKRSNKFLENVLQGYLDGDGHWTGERWRLGFCSNDNWAADLRTICARIGKSIRLKRTKHTMTNNGERRTFPGWRGEIRDVHKNDSAEVMAVENSRARKFWDIALEKEPHLFSLSSGILTHNSNPMPESVTDRCTKAHEYLFLLSKSARYFYDAEAVKEKSIWYGKDAGSDKGNIRYEGKRTAAPNELSGQQGFATITQGRNRRSVFTCPSEMVKMRDDLPEETKKKLVAELLRRGII